jgi:hypothetical protein
MGAEYQWYVYFATAVMQFSSTHCCFFRQLCQRHYLQFPCKWKIHRKVPSHLQCSLTGSSDCVQHVQTRNLLSWLSQGCWGKCQAAVTVMLVVHTLWCSLTTCIICQSENNTAGSGRNRHCHSRKGHFFWWLGGAEVGRCIHAAWTGTLYRNRCPRCWWLSPKPSRA